MSEAHARPASGDIRPWENRDWERSIRPLPLRAAAAFALRCARRVEPLARLGTLSTEAYSARLDDVYLDERCGLGSAALAAAHSASAAAAASADPLAATYQASLAAAHASTATRYDRDHTDSMKGDLRTLAALRLGPAGEPGEPIRWDDPRLGLLWPGGEPEWSTEVKKACRELEDCLRRLPDPNTPNFSDDEIAQLDAYHRMREKDGAGELRRYAGQYVISDGETIFAHGRNLSMARRKAEKLARGRGLNPERLADYHVPAAE